MVLVSRVCALVGLSSVAIAFHYRINEPDDVGSGSIHPMTSHPMTSHPMTSHPMTSHPIARATMTRNVSRVHRNASHQITVTRALQGNASHLHRNASHKKRKVADDMCPPGYFWNDGDTPGLDMFTPDGIHSADTIELCAESCEAEPECLSFEYLPATLRCYRNNIVNPTSSLGWDAYGQIFCSRAESDDDMCPDGYYWNDGDVPGLDMFTSGGVHSEDSIELCAQSCDAEPQCLAFEYLPATSMCYRNNVGHPTDSRGWDSYGQIFCSRNECNDDMCPGGYCWTDGDVPGLDMFTPGGVHSEDSIELCAQSCDAEPECLAFEYLPATSRCYRNNVGHPTDSHGWDAYGQIFCSR